MDQGQSKRITKRIRAFGIVQGVGFRPLVYRVANKLDITGYVRNVGGYVEILLQGEQDKLDMFLQELQEPKYNSYEIIKLEQEDIQSMEYDSFTILGSHESDEVSVIPPDLPVCEACQKELMNPIDRRYRNPFISCMSCGPRYTIIDTLPYDRENTTMEEFVLCSECLTEYTSPDSRRHHAQTISCDDCGPYLIYQEVISNKQITSTMEGIESKEISNQSKHLSCNHKNSNDDALQQAIHKLKNGGILAVKGIGGYHYVCSPFMEDTVVKLRSLKGREEKPFAVMFEKLESVQEYCYVSKEEQQLLLTKARPIVLLYTKGEQMAPSTNKGSMYCGAFLPYTPLQLLLTRECGPLIMTSANKAGKPIIREDKEMLLLDSEYLTAVLYHPRSIVRSVEDSVAKIINHKPQLIRRSRGYVPYPVFITEEMRDDHNNPSILAAGGDLKAAFCLYQKGKAVVSGFLGDLEEVEIMKEYETSVEDLKHLLKIEPRLAVCDLHPGYYSSNYVKGLGIPILEVQHHHAHIASIMAEHDLKGKVIGVAFDGTGYGTDGAIWGGEFLLCENDAFQRAAHLRYTNILGGDQSMKDTKKTATSYLLEAGLDQYCNDDRIELIRAAIKNQINVIPNSSMGRLFDAIASLLDLGDWNRYEGECASALEKEAVMALRTQCSPTELSFAIDEKNEIIEINPDSLINLICALRDHTPTKALALGFHYAVAKMIGEVCDRIRYRTGSKLVALGGGVFQNTVLTEKAIQILTQNGFEVFVNLSVPPNDGCISLGQTYVALQSLTQGC